MTPDELKQIRADLRATQTQLAGLLGVSSRALQNWEQSTDNKSHRDIPEEMAARVLMLAELKKDQEGSGSGLPYALQWIQLPMTKAEIKALEKRAIDEHMSSISLIRKLIYNEIT